VALAKSAKRLQAFDTEFGLACELFTRGDLDAAFHHLERAHVLGQPWAIHHTRAHWLMLKIGLKRRDVREIFGQIIRIAGGGLLSWVGRLPEGNTGGANVPAEKPMPLPPDLKALCDA
jgi:hypothetical protein